MCINKIKTALNNMKLSKILFKRSNEEYKTPRTSEISAGEIALNTNESSPFITIGGKGPSGEIKTVNIYRDRFFLNVVKSETDGNIVYGLDEASKIKIKKFKIGIDKDPIKNGMFLLFEDKVYSLNIMQLTNEQRIVFDNLSMSEGKIIYSTLEYNRSTSLELEWFFTYNEEELYPVTGGDVKLDGYTSELIDEDEKIITPDMTLNEALQKLEKVTLENELTISAAINQLNERLTRLENA